MNFYVNVSNAMDFVQNERKMKTEEKKHKPHRWHDVKATNVKIAYGKPRRWAINSMKRKFVHIEDKNEMNKRKTGQSVCSLVYLNDVQRCKYSFVSLYTCVLFLTLGFVFLSHYCSLAHSFACVHTIGIGRYFSIEHSQNMNN